VAAAGVALRAAAPPPPEVRLRATPARGCPGFCV
jgi:hypothetical protein